MWVSIPEKFAKYFPAILLPCTQGTRPTSRLSAAHNLAECLAVTCAIQYAYIIV